MRYENRELCEGGPLLGEKRRLAPQSTPHRNPNGERGALSGRGIHLDAAAVEFSAAFADEQV
jgi:hypothetical protein